MRVEATSQGIVLVARTPEEAEILRRWDRILQGAKACVVTTFIEGSLPPNRQGAAPPTFEFRCVKDPSKDAR